MGCSNVENVVKEKEIDIYLKKPIFQANYEEKQVFVLGSTFIDIKISQLPYMPEKDSLIITPNFSIEAGGIANSQACALAKLGIPTYLISCIGKMGHRKYRQNDDEFSSVSDFDFIDVAKVSEWEKLKLKTQFVQQLEGKTGTRMILDVGGKYSIIEYIGNNNKMDKNLIINALTQANERDIFLTTLEPLTGIEETDERFKLVENVLLLARKKKMLTVLSPVPAYKFKRLDLVDFLVVFKKELDFLTGLKIDETKSLEKVIENAYKILNPENLGRKKNPYYNSNLAFIVCLGPENGCCIFYMGMFARMSAPEGRPVLLDNTSCRGAFTGGLISQISKGKSPEDALEYANYAMSYCSSKVGAISSLPTDNEVKKRMTKSKIIYKDN